jgi:hypothetical protein
MTFGFYGDTAEVQLPHPPIPLSVSLVVENAICASWHLLRTQPRAGFVLLTATENDITNALKVALLDRVFNKGIVDGFDREVFASITRDPKVENYDKSNCEKMPDLVIGLVNRPSGVINSQDGLFIECKPVDVDHSVGKHYCDRGLIRFIRGDYAWAMTSALMVGYSREGYAILPKLHDALIRRSLVIPTLENPHPCGSSEAGPNNELVHISQHARTFTYLETGQLAQAITIRHLWLRRD